MGNYKPQPGAQNPAKYGGRIGPRYQMYGEQEPYYIYQPWSDTYVENPRAVQDYYVQAGVLEAEEEPPKPPGIWEQSAALAVPGLVGLGGKYIMESIFSPSTATAAPAAAAAAPAAAAPVAAVPVQQAPTLLDRVGGLLGIGTESAPATTVATPTAAAQVVPVGSAATTEGLPGVLMSDGSIVAAESASPWALSGIGATGNYLLPIGGLLGIGDVLMNKKHGMSGALQGAASGAAIGSFFPGVGTVIGAAIGAITGYFGNFGDEDMWKTERDSLNKLSEKGIYIPQNLLSSMNQITGGRSKEELIRGDLPADFVGADSSGTWVNNKFAASRNEADLTPTDIVNYSTFAEHDPSWFQKPMEERLAYAERALSAGAVREHHGTVDVDFKKLEA